MRIAAETNGPQQASRLFTHPEIEAWDVSLARVPVSGSLLGVFRLIPEMSCWEQCVPSRRRSPPLPRPQAELKQDPVPGQEAPASPSAREVPEAHNPER